MLHIANPIYENNRLEKLLDVFCQDRKDKDNMQILNVDEEMMEEDEEMRRIVTRLLSAASDSQVRHSMNIEEEINTALENRDTEIMLYKNEATKAKKLIAEKEEQISKQSEQLSKKDEQLSRQSEQLSKQSEQLVAAIRLLHSNGLSKEQIASSLGIGIDTVDKTL